MCRLICVLGCLPFVAASAQSPPQPPTLKTTTAAVLIDVTVLDRGGQTVADLGPADFELTEDGARQQILSVSFVNNGVPVPPASSAPPAEGLPAPAAGGSVASIEARPPVTDAGEPLSVTAILFDRLSPEGRRAAGPAAQAYVAGLLPGRDYAGVFFADLALRTFQPFTNDRERLRVAVDRLSQAVPANTTADAERLRGRHAPALDPNQPPTAGAESGTGFVSVGEREKYLDSLSRSERLLAEMELRMEQGHRQVLAEYGGEASLAGLRAVVDALGSLPGRKSIVYFVESLSITSRLKPRFDALIGTANRHNITIYAIDTAGLRVHSREMELGRNVGVAAAQGIGDSRRDDGPWTKELERQEQLLSSRPAAALGRLAKETGGFLLEDTNDLTARMERIQRERTSYYVLAYQPTKAALDGTFRKVSVKVKRPRVTVKARTGYLAVPPQQG
ncbi:MAG TPA: VWA domain-containing protein [Vicinamibacterales bacterium]|nr:VWA domain-containing protein [Vicinamibacterales bacterium]